MKSIKQQYIDLREGNMTQANFMRNLRMTLPQYITNVTSFEDSVRILKNKGILTEMLDPIAAEEIAKQMGSYDAAVVRLEDMGLSSQEANKIASDIYPEEDFPEEDEFDDESWWERSGRFDENNSLKEAKDGSEGKWKKVTGKDLYSSFKEINNLNGHEVAQGIDWEMQNNQELTKEEATKIVIKKLKKNPLYYTSWDLSGVEGYEPETMGPKSDIEARQMQFLDKNMGNVVDKKMGMKPVKDVEKIKKDSDKATAQKYKTSGIDMMSLIAKTVRGLKKMDATGEKMKKVNVKENKVAKTIFDKNANITKGVTDIAKGKDKKKLTKEYLLQMIQEELNEMFDGMEPMGRKGLDEANLSSQEQKITDDILNTLDEGMFSDVLEKVKSYAKKGLITAAILGALLSAPNFSQAQKQQIKQIAQTEMSSTQKMDDLSLGNALVKAYEKNPKAAEVWYKNHRHTSLVDVIKSVIKTGKNEGEIKDLGNTYQNNKDAQDFLTYMAKGNTTSIR